MHLQFCRKSHESVHVPKLYVWKEHATTNAQPCFSDLLWPITGHIFANQSNDHDDHLVGWAVDQLVDTGWHTRGGVLPMWWVIHMCRGFDPLFSLWQDRARSSWGTFSHPPTAKLSFGVQKLPIFTKIDLFGPKFNFFLDLFGSNFQRPAAHPHQFSSRVPPPPPPPPRGDTPVWWLGMTISRRTVINIAKVWIPDK